LYGVWDRSLSLSFGECAEHACCGLQGCRTTRAGVKVGLDDGVVGCGKVAVEQVMRV
jgi:hypothetical protein